MADNLREGGVNRVLLLTDGLANVGIVEPGKLTGLSHQGVKKEVGDLYAREPRRIVMAILLPPGSAAPGTVAEVAQLTVTAHVLTPEGGVELQEITIPVTLSPEEGGKAEPEIRGIFLRGIRGH